jgi:hypothetical protein
MRVEQRQWSRSEGWQVIRADPRASEAQLVLFFGGREAITAGAPEVALRAAYPGASLVGCSTAGEICGTEVADDTIVATAVRLERSRVRSVCRSLTDAAASRRVGEQLARDLDHDGLAHVFVVAEGLHVNGSELVEGLRLGLPERVAITGGLAGDGARFERTVVVHETEHVEGAVVAIGFYGEHFRVGYGSMGGWDPFGPDRLITRSTGNVLFEFDGRPALELYKSYLGPHADELPSSGLLFPLSLRRAEGGPRVVRTILGVDEQAGSLIFAGDVPEGDYAQLMKANVDRLIDGAHGAASACITPMDRGSADLAVLISCVGRKLVLKQRVEEEVESVREVLGPGTVLCGFYSYGEIAPFSTSAKCELHNQTMTITTFSER